LHTPHFDLGKMTLNDPGMDGEHLGVKALCSTGQRGRVCRHVGVSVRPDGSVLEVVGEFISSVFLQWTV
jgi:hypothetical protein